MLVPLASGLCLAREWPVSPLPAALAGLALVVGAVASLRLKGAVGRALWAVLFGGGVFLLACAYGGVRFADRQDWRAALPVREARLELRVERSFGVNAYGSARGVAIIREAPPEAPHLVGQRVIFSADAPQTLPIGASFRVTGLVRHLAPEAEAGTFDSWLRQKQVHYELRRGRVEEGSFAAPPAWRVYAERSRRWMADVLMQGSDKLDSVRSMHPAMFLGEYALISPQDMELFKSTGMLHLFAVSGMHVALLALIVEGMLAILRLGRTRRILLGMLILTVYTVVIGAPPSAVRSLIMLAFHRAGQLWGRPARGVPALAASAVAVLIWDPLQLFDIGARLSYGIVAGILLYGAPLGELLKKKIPLYEFLPRSSIGRRERFMLASRDWACVTAGVSLGAFVFGAPLSMQYFGVFTPGTLLLNIFLVPVSFLGISAAAFGLCAKWVSMLPFMGWLEGASVFLNHAGWTCSLIMHDAVEYGASLPGMFTHGDFGASWVGGVVVVGLLWVAVMLRGEPVRERLRWQLAPLWLLLGAVAIYIAAQAVA
jgi:competence protein ComEC